MVKIKNPLGDVKIGKQGEVVYQLKYGEQIRRMAAPKRAMASQAQIAHRQLYRDALSWRKQLSLPNRRYLDGYCIANGVVDHYHIPLPWSRFALKLYLQKVDFVTAIKPTFVEEEKEGIDQAYDNEAHFDYYLNIYGAYYYAHTFKLSQDFHVSKIACYLRRHGSPILLYVGIYQTDGEGHPTGSPLVESSYPLGTVGADYDWHELALPSPLLNQGQLYALRLNQDPGGSANRHAWKGDSSAPTYPDGCLEASNDYGASWTTDETVDKSFRIYVKWTEKAVEPGLLHVKHPALLKLVHKRGEQTINVYDTLSSLDEEYLTGQVGLDVEVGDTIKATTLPGIEYAHQVH